MEKNNCCTTTEDGSMVCNLPQNGETATCQQKNEEERFAARFRSASLFLIGCVTSPCCTPLYVPIVLSVFAGTSLALWLSQNLFWVYGLLSLISLLSFIIALRPKAQKAQPKSSNLISISSIRIGEKSYVEATK